MPKQEITKEIVLDAALDMTRKGGHECVNARSVAEFMGRSVQPIYSYFQNMDELKGALYKRAAEFYDEFIRANSDMLDLCSMAKANVLFAKREKNLFRLLYLSKLDRFNGFGDILSVMGHKPAVNAVSQREGIATSAAEKVYVMLIVFTHGIAAMAATGAAELQDDEICALIDNAYKSFINNNK